MYKLYKEIVSRNIGGLYFLIDIKDKYCYDFKKIYSVNQIGNALFNIMRKLELFNIAMVAEELKKQLSDYHSSLDEQIDTDVKDFIQRLIDVGYIGEVK